MKQARNVSAPAVNGARASYRLSSFLALNATHPLGDLAARIAVSDSENVDPQALARGVESVSQQVASLCAVAADYARLADDESEFSKVSRDLPAVLSLASSVAGLCALASGAVAQFGSKGGDDDEH